MMLSGFLFLFILVLNLVMGALGYLMEKDEYEPNADLKKINKNPKKFQIGITLALIEHSCVIALTILLFIAFSSYNIMLGIILIIFRTGEGLIQFYNEPFYWKLINIAKRYSSASGAEKKSLSELGRSILKTKNSVFSFGQIFFSIGTFAYSLLFVISEAVPVPAIIGWFGIFASIIYGFGNGIILVKPNKAMKIFRVGLLILILEIVLGGWLLFSPLI